jgi:hypothetical protein
MLLIFNNSTCTLGSDTLSKRHNRIRRGELRCRKLSVAIDLSILGIYVCKKRLKIQLKQSKTEECKRNCVNSLHRMTEETVLQQSL